MEQRWRGISEETAVKHAAQRTTQRAFAAGLLLRQKNFKCFTKLGVALGIEMVRSTSSRHDDNILVSMRAVPSHSYIRAGLEATDWVKPQVFPNTTASKDYAWAVRDNLEIWMKVKYSRWVRGKLLESRIIHTVTGANGGIPTNIILAPAPTLKGRCHENPWPFVGKYDLKKALLKRDAMDNFFAKKWTAALTNLEGNVEGLLARPPAAEDLAHPRYLSCT